MLKNIVKLEVTVGERIYHLLCDNDSPIGEVKEALFQIAKVVGDIEAKITSVKQEQETKQVDEPQKEEKPND
jgi:hypothetical protein